MSLEDDFAVFVKAHSGRLLRAAWLLTGQWPSAEDLVQTALERTWPRWGKLATDERRLAHLRKVVTTSFLRDRKR
jgi:DNA-directed RNA polymerase specialized sigma24 family protein